jgi:hypothetical protein
MGTGGESASTACPGDAPKFARRFVGVRGSSGCAHDTVATVVATSAPSSRPLVDAAGWPMS